MPEGTVTGTTSHPAASEPLSILGRTALLLVLLVVALRTVWTGQGSGIGLVALGSWCILAAAAMWVLSEALRGEVALPSGAPVAFLLIYLAYLVVSPAWAADRFAALEGAVPAASNVLLFFLIVAMAHRHGALARVLPPFLAALAVPLCCLALYQYFVGIPYLREMLERDPDLAAGIPEALRQELTMRLAGAEPFATFAHPNILAGFLALLLPVTVGLWFDGKGAGRLGGGAVAVLLVSTILLTGSRGGMLAVMVGLAAMCWFRVFFRLPMRVRWGSAVLGALGVVGCIAGGIYLMHHPDRVSPFSSIGIRLGYLEGTFALIRENFWWGVGVGNFGIEYTRVKPDWAGEVIHAHNDFAEWFSEIGFLGFHAWVVGQATLLRRGAIAWHRGRGREGGPRTAGAAVAAAIVLAYLAGDLMDASFVWWEGVPLVVPLALAGTGIGAYRLFGGGSMSPSGAWTSCGLAAGVLAYWVHVQFSFGLHVPGSGQTFWVCLAAVAVASGALGVRVVRAGAVRWGVAILFGAGALAAVGPVMGLLRYQGDLGVGKEALARGDVRGMTRIETARDEVPYSAEAWGLLTGAYHTGCMAEDLSAEEERKQVEVMLLCTATGMRTLELSPHAASLFALHAERLEDHAAQVRRGLHRCTAAERANREEMASGWEEGAAGLWRRAVHYYPTRAHNQYRLARALDRAGGGREALLHYREALRLETFTDIDRLRLTQEEREDALKRVEALGA